MYERSFASLADLSMLTCAILCSLILSHSLGRAMTIMVSLIFLWSHSGQSQAELLDGDTITNHAELNYDGGSGPVSTLVDVVFQRLPRDSEPPTGITVNCLSTDPSAIAQSPRALPAGCVDGSVFENTPGQILAALTVIDTDQASDHQLSVEDDARFEVVNGNLKLVDNEQVNFEVEPIISITLLAIDTDGNQFRLPLTIEVKDVNEAPFDLIIDNSYVPADLPGLPIGAFFVSDVDATEAHVFEVVDDQRFIVTNDVLTLAPDVSLEEDTEILITVVATDKGGLTTQAVVEVSTNADSQNIPDTPATINFLAANATGTRYSLEVSACSVPDVFRPDAGSESFSRNDVTGDQVLALADAYSVGDALIVSVVDPDQNFRATSKETLTVFLTGENDAETLVLTESEIDSGIFVGYLATTSELTASEDCIITVAARSTVTATYIDPTDQQDNVASQVSFSPFGIIFDDETGEAVDGIIITLVDATTGLPAEVRGEGPFYARFPSAVVSGTSLSDSAGNVVKVQAGEYGYPSLAAGRYRLEIFNSRGWAISTKTNAELQRLRSAQSRSLETVSEGQFFLGQASRGIEFTVSQGALPRVDIPLRAVAREIDPSELTQSEISFLQYSANPNIGTAVNVGQTSCVGGQTRPVSELRGINVPVPGVVNLIPATVFKAGQPIFVKVKDGDQNNNPLSREKIIIQIEVEASTDLEFLALTETGPDTGEFVGYIQSIENETSTNSCVLGVVKDQPIKTSYTDAFDQTDASDLQILVDPFGKIFSTKDGRLIDGITVTLIDTATGAPAQVYGDGPLFAEYPNPIVSGSEVTDSGGVFYDFPSGEYRFPFVEAGFYQLELSNIPDGFVNPSVVTIDAIQSLSGAPFEVVDGSRGGEFEVPVGPALHIDIPLDEPQGEMFISKRANKEIAAIGDFVQYQLTVENKISSAISDTRIQDTLPKGFRYQTGSLRINGATGSDPTIGSDGRQMLIDLPEVSSSTLRVSYVVEITSGAEKGVALNVASVVGNLVASTNVATARILVKDDLFRDKAILIGKVSLQACPTSAGGRPVDSNADSNDVPEVGLAGVRLYLEDGSYVITDDDGMWHMEGIEPGTHVVQLDTDSLEHRYEVSPCNESTRFAGSAYSQFVDVQGGSLWRADFAVQQKADPESIVSVEQSLEVDDEGLWVLIKAENEGEVQLNKVNAIYNVPKGWQIKSGTELLNSNSVKPSETIVGSVFTLGALNKPAQLRFALEPRKSKKIERDLKNDKPVLQQSFQSRKIINADILNGESAVRLSFRSAGTPRGRTAVNKLPLNRLAGGFDKLNATVEAKALGTWDALEFVGDNTPGARDPLAQGFINIHNGERMGRPVQAVKLDLDSRLKPKLLLDHVEIPRDRIGFSMVDDETGKTLYSYIGVNFGEPGVHSLQLQGLDNFGNARFDETIEIVRVGDLFDIRVLETGGNIADGRTPVTVKLLLTDRQGEPLNVAHSLTLESQELERFDRDLNLSDLSEISDNDYVQVEPDGTLKFNPVSQSGRFTAKLIYDEFDREIEVFVEPEKRDWIMVGLAEGSVAHRTVSGNMEALRTADLDDEFATDGRIAFYAKGRVKGEYVLTLSYDTAKEEDTVLTQAIDPDSYYMLYGDRGATQYDAASKEKLYLKIERDQFYAVFGDFSSGLSLTELSNYSRTLTGLKTEYKGDQFEVNAFVSEVDQAFIKDEIRGDGTSGLYRLGSVGILANSEKITVQTRDRFHSEDVLKSQFMTRHIDYNIDYDAGTIFFKAPVYSQDAAFNPVFIVVDYEIRGDGKDRLNAGGRVAYKPLENTELGATLVKEGIVGRETELAGLDLTIGLGESTEIRAEVATTKSKLESGETSGIAYLAEIEHRDGRLEASGYIREQESGFGLGQQNSSESGTRKVGAEATYWVADNVELTAEAYRKTGLAAGNTQDVISSGTQYRTDNLTLNSGIRSARTTANGEEKVSHQLLAGSTYRMLDGKVGLSANADTTLGGKGEAVNFPKRLRVGLDYKITESMTLKSEQEFTWGDKENTQGTRIGLSSRLWEGGELVTNVQQVDEENSQRLAAVAGLKQRWEMNEQWSFDFGVDRSQTIKSTRSPPALEVTTVYSSPNDDDFTSVTFGSKFRKAAWDWATRVEYRGAESEDKLNIVSDVIHNLEEGKQLLAKVDYQKRMGESTSGTTTGFQLGYSYRPVDSRWSMLNRLDLSSSNYQGQGGDIKTQKVINNLNANFLWSDNTQIALQYGLKYVVDNFNNDEYSGFTDLYGLELRHDLSAKWDVGFQSSFYNSWHAGVSDQSYGVSVGYNMARNAWMSLGYNFDGFSDDDFSASEYTAEGIFLKYRMKFDQHSARSLFGD